MKKMKEYIPELDGEGKSGNLKKFREAIEKNFGKEISEWKSTLSKKLEGTLDIDNYLRGINL